MRFVCDVMLGKLAKYLRLFGFDTIYARTEKSVEGYLDRDRDRILLTRRRSSPAAARTIQIKSEIVREQLRELAGVIRAGIRKEMILNRCLACNVELADVDRTEIEPLVPEFVYHNYRRFRICPSCKRVYWEGSHTLGMQQLIEEIVG